MRPMLTSAWNAATRTARRARHASRSPRRRARSRRPRRACDEARGSNLKPITMTGLNTERTYSGNPVTATAPTRIFLTLSEIPNVSWVGFFLEAHEALKDPSWTKAEILRDGIVIECPLDQPRI